MRNILISIAKPLLRVLGFFSSLPSFFRRHKVSPPSSVSHSQWANFLSKEFDKKGMRILEIGSRNVTGQIFRDKFKNAEYVGFDYYAGENVDIVGDCHKLSNYFDEEECFDLIFSSAVFEHLCMPWVVAEEIRKLLKTGGMVFIETHFSHSSHERPWHFFQFSDMGLRSLFNEAMGFQLIEKGLSNPIWGVFDRGADSYLRYLPVPELYCHSEILCKKVKEVKDFDWRSVSVNEVVDDTVYPSPNPPNQ